MPLFRHGVDGVALEIVRRMRVIESASVFHTMTVVDSVYLRAGSVVVHGMWRIEYDRTWRNGDLAPHTAYVFDRSGKTLATIENVTSITTRDEPIS